MHFGVDSIFLHGEIIAIKINVDEGKTVMSETENILLAKEKIADVLKRYCRAMDRIDVDLGYTVWHEDGLADYGSFYVGTGRGFIDWVCKYHSTLEAQSHQLANMLINIDGDCAVSETYVTVTLIGRKNEKQYVITGCGRYLDEWSCRAGLWAIDRRKFIYDFEYVRDAQMTLGWGRRDSADPSYPLLGVLGSA